jgi:hypothetical protein
MERHKKESEMRAKLLDQALKLSMVMSLLLFGVGCGSQAEQKPTDLADQDESGSDKGDGGQGLKDGKDKGGKKGGKGKDKKSKEKDPLFFYTSVINPAHCVFAKWETRGSKRDGEVPCFGVELNADVKFGESMFLGGDQHMCGKMGPTLWDVTPNIGCPVDASMCSSGYAEVMRSVVISGTSFTDRKNLVAEFHKLGLPVEDRHLSTYVKTLWVYECKPRPFSERDAWVGSVMLGGPIQNSMDCDRSVTVKGQKGDVACIVPSITPGVEVPHPSRKYFCANPKYPGWASLFPGMGCKMDTPHCQSGIAVADELFSLKGAGSIPVLSRQENIELAEIFGSDIVDGIRRRADLTWVYHCQ